MSITGQPGWYRESVKLLVPEDGSFFYCGTVKRIRATAPYLQKEGLILTNQGGTAEAGCLSSLNGRQPAFYNYFN